MSGRKIAYVTFAAAAVLGCNNESLNVGPRTASSALSRGANDGTQLPFRGSFTTFESIVIAPPNLLSDLTIQGTATRIGRFTATCAVVVDLATGSATGTCTFTAASGDQLSYTFTGQGVETSPGVSSITEVATIVGGTGRFAAATGTFTIQRTITFNQAGTAVGSGSFDGHITRTN